MSELGDLLEVVHRAHRSFTSVRLEAREWPRWWQRMPGWATTSDEDDGWGEGQVGHSIRPLLDPWPVLAGLDLVVEGSTRIAGREAKVLGATSRPHPHLGGTELLAYGADRHELVIDAERGVLLRAASLLDDEPFSSVEVLTVAFDERFGDDVFAFAADPGEEVVRPEDVSPGDVVTVEEAARRASFTVLAPRSLGRGWRSHVLYTPGHEGTRVRETVHLAFYRDDASHSVSLRQTAGPWESWQTNGTEEAERGGRSLRLSVGPWHRVLLEESGTFVEVDSQTVETETLVELALALEPAPTEPPPLVA